MKRQASTMIILLSAISAALAAGAPESFNYQGVLRDSSDAPLDGEFGMVFRLFDAESEGGSVGHQEGNHGCADGF